MYLSLKQFIFILLIIFSGLSMVSVDAADREKIVGKIPDTATLSSNVSAPLLFNLKIRYFPSAVVICRESQ